MFTDKERKLIFTELDKIHISGLSILGGEPLEQAEELCEFLSEVKERFPEKSIWLWTGFTFNEVVWFDLPVIKYVDVLVDGRFIEEQKDITLKFRGSRNQRIINMKEV